MEQSTYEMALTSPGAIQFTLTGARSTAKPLAYVMIAPVPPMIELEPFEGFRGLEP